MLLPHDSTYPFLLGGGETGALMRSHDWSRSPLGEPGNWPQSLRTVVGLMLNSMFPMFIAWGPELAMLYNDSYAEILGNKHPQAMGTRFETVWREIWNDIEPIARRAMEGDATYHQNLPLTMNRKGYDEQTWFTFSYSPIRDESGGVGGMFCAVTETTEQILAQRHRAEELERMRALFEQAPGIIGVMRGPEHVFELVNDTYRQLVGYRDMVGLPVREAVPELEGQGFFELLDQVYQSGEPYVGRAVPVRLQRRPDAELEERFVNFVYQPIRDELGRVSGIFVEGSDVTEMIRTTEALRESEVRLRQLANNIPQLAWMADPDGNIHWYNDRWYDYTGTTLEQMRGWGWQAVHHPDTLPRVMEKWKTSLATGEPFHEVFPLRSASGEYRTFATRVAPLRDAAGNLVQWFGTNTDITDIEATQNELKQASRRKDEFLAMLAHELRNPLAPISTAAELLRLGGADAERVRNASLVISRQVAHMSDLVDDLLDVSRVTRGLVTIADDLLDVKTVLTEAIEQVRALIEARRHTLDLELTGQDCLVRGDRTRLIQVFSNILNNAAKYTPEGGRLALSVAVRETQVEVTVRDNGIGMSSALLPHVFDLFTQAERTPDRSQGGLGLGLSLVKSLVELHGGSVTAASDGSGRGSAFVVCLPRVSDEAERRTPRDEPSMPQVSGSGLPLMVIDDNEDAAHTLAQLLELLGHKVTVGYTARHALEALSGHAPDMVFLDIGLPDMDGYELARRLRAHPAMAQVTLVAISGYGQPGDRLRAREAGFDHHLVKPVTLDAVTALLQQRQAQ